MPGPRPKYAITLTPEQEARLQQLSTCYMAPFATVQRAQILVLAHRYPEWQHAAIAQQVGCHVNTVKQWRQRWSGEKLAQVAVAQGIVGAISPGTIRRWLRADKIKPWR